MTAIRDTTVEWLLDLEPNYLVTHNFGYGVRQADGDPKIKHFYNRVMGAAYGRNWAKRPAADWVRVVAVWERVDADLNPHAHAVVHAPEAVAAVLRGPAAGFWKDIAPRGQLDVQRLHSPERAAHYITKRVFAGADLDRLFVYTKSNEDG